MVRCSVGKYDRLGAALQARGLGLPACPEDEAKLRGCGMMKLQWIFGAEGQASGRCWWQRLGAMTGLLPLLITVPLSGQWVLTSIHPDPTPPQGAPEAEFVALMAQGGPGSCVSSQGLALGWNGHERFLPDSCWAAGTVLVAHRAADSLSFDFGTAHPLPMATWPALVNGGGTVVVTEGGGTVLDAMSYDAASLSGGGRPLMRSHLWACGAAENQHLWSWGMDPYRAPVAEGGQQVDLSLDSVLAVARHPDRLVPRGAGALDWYLGFALNPVSMLQARGWAGGKAAQLTWRSDSVARLEWDARPDLPLGAAGDQIPITVGPISGCWHEDVPRMLTGSFLRDRHTGSVEVVGVMADPLPGDPLMPGEAVALLNRSGHVVDAGPWSFEGAQLRRRTRLLPDSIVWLSEDAFEDWPGMPNDGGSFTISLPRGSRVAATAWSPCDHDAPQWAGSGLPLVRAGPVWQTSGQKSAEVTPLAIRGYGCPSDNGSAPQLWVYLDRYVAHIPPLRWASSGEISAAPVGEWPSAVGLSWNASTPWDPSATLEVSVIEDSGLSVTVPVQCPSASSGAGDGVAPCLRISEMMWNANEKGSEFVEVLNCGEQPIELAGLQATTALFPAPSDWDTWVPQEQSLVLLPGGVAAFGRCPKWMAHGLPMSGPARWSADGWSALNDEEGQLSIRLPSVAVTAIDEVQWGSGLKGPWWWSEDGWAWIRSGPGPGDWTPAPDKGSPGGLHQIPLTGDCGEVELLPAAPLHHRLPGLQWSLPDAGGAIGLKMIGWPSGDLRGHVVIEDVLPEGQWSWAGTDASGLPVLPGLMLWEVRWWGGLCRGKRRFVVEVPGHG